MVKDPIRRNEHLIGATAVLAATGRGRAEWFELLDAAGATGWDHRTVAAWLVEQQGVEPWWAQSLTVGYEQTRGLRLPGQRPDGTFEVSATRTVAGTPEVVLPWVVDADRRRLWLDEDPVTTSAPGTRGVRWTWGDGTRTTVRLHPQPSGRTRVSVQHRGVADGEGLADLKASWAGRLDALAAALAP
jgi:hypothetical protein